MQKKLQALKNSLELKLSLLDKKNSLNIYCAAQEMIEKIRVELNEKVVCRGEKIKLLYFNENSFRILLLCSVAL